MFQPNILYRVQVYTLRLEPDGLVLKPHFGGVVECVFQLSRWRCVVVSAYCNPSHFLLCGHSYFRSLKGICVKRSSTVCYWNGPVAGSNKPHSSAFNHMCLLIKYTTQSTSNATTIMVQCPGSEKGRNLVMVR